MIRKLPELPTSLAEQSVARQLIEEGWTITISPCSIPQTMRVEVHDPERSWTGSVIEESLAAGLLAIYQEVPLP